ncbi:putative exopolysaccharide synthesis protein [Gordonia polyisoprenivorans VH2]|uniref:non-specific protein-tyrosine kinase n=1 Tax=Gordonia polyisoprenivorans (strain DSM 44266 / VH2) TaxID=1112204 RepID=H6N1H1_GORPV|nr:polysaccharide biosynthesis tyrosine autokinase [Gordonia polyisoprenivorans]AFA72182.1 putative exopolysaccharide synthesis protein [Gordonia polyisoprenivorans VH2]
MSAGRLSIRGIGSVFRRGWWLVALISAVSCVGALLFSLASERIYESSVSLYVTAAGDESAAAVYQGSLAAQQRAVSYAELVKSDVVVNDAIKRSGLNISTSEARARLESVAQPDTVLLKITAKSGVPGDAAALANGAANSMVNYVRVLEQPSEGSAALAKLTIVSPASVSDTPVSPNVSRNLGVAVLAGLLIGACVVVLRERFDSRFRSVSEIEQAVGSSVLGAIPSSDVVSSVGVLDFSSGGDSVCESFRHVRTNLEFANIDSEVRKILVSSPSASDGKSTTSSNLAAVLAENGSSVVLVDGDLRRPSIASRFPVNGDVGFTDFLRGDASLGSLIQASGVENLSILSAGKLPPNPAEVVSSQRAETCLAELGQMFDYVLVDSPPIMPVSDSVILSKFVDGVVLVVRSGVSKRVEVERTLRQLEIARVRVLGVVANDTARSDQVYGYAHYSGYSQVASQRLD